MSEHSPSEVYLSMLERLDLMRTSLRGVLRIASNEDLDEGSKKIQIDNVLEDFLLHLEAVGGDLELNVREQTVLGTIKQRVRANPELLAQRCAQFLGVLTHDSRYLVSWEDHPVAANIAFLDELEEVIDKLLNGEGNLADLCYLEELVGGVMCKEDNTFDPEIQELCFGIEGCIRDAFRPNGRMNTIGLGIKRVEAGVMKENLKTLSNQVEGSTDAEKSKRMNRILDKLRDVFGKIKVLYSLEESGEDTAQTTLEIDQMVSELIFSIDTCGFSELAEEERCHLDELRNRPINEVSAYIGTLADLYSSIETRENTAGLIDMGVDGKFGMQKTFLAQFLVAIDRFRQDPSIDNLIKVRALVKVYERMHIQDSIAQESVEMHCDGFAEFFNANLMACLRPGGEFQEKTLSRIENGAESLFKSLKPKAKA